MESVRKYIYMHSENTYKSQIEKSEFITNRNSSRQWKVAFGIKTSLSFYK